MANEVSVEEESRQEKLERLLDEPDRIASPKLCFEYGMNVTPKPGIIESKKEQLERMHGRIGIDERVIARVPASAIHGAPKDEGYIEILCDNHISKQLMRNLAPSGYKQMPDNPSLTEGYNCTGISVYFELTVEQTKKYFPNKAFITKKGIVVVG